jgi:arsenate reductase-like glutaredoxin family protein
MILYGISTCDTCKKAIKSLTLAGQTVGFRDIRGEPLTAAEIEQIVTEFGDRAINKQSTTYRGFSDFMRLSEPEVQIAAHPAVMKRPVIHADGKWYIGWDDAVQAKLLASA